MSYTSAASTAVSETKSHECPHRPHLVKIRIKILIEKNILDKQIKKIWYIIHIVGWWSKEKQLVKATHLRITLKKTKNGVRGYICTSKNKTIKNLNNKLKYK